MSSSELALSNAIKAGSYGSRIPVNTLKSKKGEIETKVAAALALKDFDLVSILVDRMRACGFACGFVVFRDFVYFLIVTDRIYNVNIGK